MSSLVSIEIEVKPATEDMEKARIKGMLKAWIKSGVLKVSQEPNPRRKGYSRPAIVVGCLTLSSISLPCSAKVATKVARIR